jgi:hypothetical protein
MPGTVAGGVQMMARSGACGRSATLRQTAQAGEFIVLRIDRIQRALEAAGRRLCSTVAPTLPGRSEAPTSATDFGANSCRGYGRSSLLSRAQPCRVWRRAVRLDKPDKHLRT